jgi:restriction system protein
MFEKHVRHAGLQAFRVVKGQTNYEVEMKASAQLATWAEQWNRRQAADLARQTREQNLNRRALSASQLATAKLLALERTRELEADRETLSQILLESLTANITPDWDKKKDRSTFPDEKPRKPTPTSVPSEPRESDTKYSPVFTEAKLSIWDKLIPSRKASKLAETNNSREQAEVAAKADFQQDHLNWILSCEKIKSTNADSVAAFHASLANWENAKREFSKGQEEQHKAVDEAKREYDAHSKNAVETYIDDVLTLSEYPDSFPREHQSDYIEETRALILDFELPNQEAFPKIKEVKYIASRSEFQETLNPDTWLRKTYDEVLYQISLRTLYELFTTDTVDALTSIVFNGWVRSIDRATGSEVHACVMSLEARKDEFLAINLQQVDFKACFRKLKGVSASKLIELSPVKPLVMLNKVDHRFVEGYSVVDGIDSRTNLAAMDWLDFENLIREVFEKEFSKGGGEVKITQASRDGGVDAVAFDPDPIRGGKIVIQAKRYTNTVGVSAVRDLYGTVHNEGANKGILVTTSEFGPDAYAFAKDKPLTLLSGGELLFLLQQHGHTAKIDLAEAKRMAAEAST